MPNLKYLYIRDAQWWFVPVRHNGHRTLWPEMKWCHFWVTSDLSTLPGPPPTPHPNVTGAELHLGWEAFWSPQRPHTPALAVSAGVRMNWHTHPLEPQPELNSGQVQRLSEDFQLKLEITCIQLQASFWSLQELRTDASHVCFGVTAASYQGLSQQSKLTISRGARKKSFDHRN